MKVYHILDDDSGTVHTFNYLFSLGETSKDLSIEDYGITNSGQKFLIWNGSSILGNPFDPFAALMQLDIFHYQLDENNSISINHIPININESKKIDQLISLLEEKLNVSQEDMVMCRLTDKPNLSRRVGYEQFKLETLKGKTLFQIGFHNEPIYLAIESKSLGYYLFYLP